MLALLLLHVVSASISKAVEPLLHLVADGTISCLGFHVKNMLSNWLNLFFFTFHCFVAPLFDGIFQLRWSFLLVFLSLGSNWDGCRFHPQPLESEANTGTITLIPDQPERTVNSGCFS